MFFPEKNPYYHGNKEIRNLQELVENLENFSEKEALWLASWVEYLGDSTLANRIRRNPKNFKTIIKKRYMQLKERG